MERSHFIGLSAVSAAFCAAGAFAAAPITLHVNTGLWQIDSQVQMHGAPPIPEEMLAKLPPDRRARVMAAMRTSMANVARPHSTKSCVTQKELDRPFRPMPDQDGVTCKQTVVSATATSEDIHLACTGRRTMDGNFHFEAPNPLTMQGHINMSFSEGGRSMSATTEVHGHWLSPNCESVKPRER